jgi:hypothetical protein
VNVYVTWDHSCTPLHFISAVKRWILDFVSDALSDGRRFRVLCVIDDFPHECLAMIADNSLSGIRFARELDAIAMTRGYDRQRQRHGADIECHSGMATTTTC